MAELSIHRAAKEGDLERVRQLIEGGVSVDSRDDRGRTSLHRAAARGRYDVVNFFTSLPECDLNAKDRNDFTPVLWAAERNKKDVVHLLLQRGAIVNCADFIKSTLLHCAARKGWTETVRHILDRGVEDINAVTRACGDTPLMMAADCQTNEDVISLLLRAGADVNRRNINKQTALHFAARHGSTRVVQVLLEEEVLELNPQDEEGETPLHWACHGGWGYNREVVKQLLVAGADTTIKNSNYETALTKGLRRGELAIEDIRLFVQHGAFIQDCEYVHIYHNPVLKESILKDVGLCTQSIVNKFHLQSLPALSSISCFARKLPKVDKFKLKGRQIDEVENMVKEEIARKGFCNVAKAHPMSLSALSVLSLITCQSGKKRSGLDLYNEWNSSFKKLHT